jgi:UDP-N-acetylmuramate--alanine ligase
LAEDRKTWFFCGVGGGGMSSIAQVLAAHGHRVIGSDRTYDRVGDVGIYRQLQGLGIILCPQDGSGVTDAIDVLVTSTAVESSIPDVGAAMDLQIPVLRRAQVLADLINGAATSIAVGGTSGKSTVTGMTGHILGVAGLQPTVINGAPLLDQMTDAAPGNAVCGRRDLVVAEADESDGTIALYDPSVAIVTNITLDHKPLPELRELFGGICQRSQQAAVLSADCPEASALAGLAKHSVTFSVAGRDADVEVEILHNTDRGMMLRCDSVEFELPVAGRHNAANAAAAIAAAGCLGVDLQTAAQALSSFAGIHRRLQYIGMSNGVTVIDDFGHNPDKIAASLDTLTDRYDRVAVLYQPHGFKSTQFLKDGLIQAFVDGLRDGDVVIFPEIYYAGGTVEKTISSAALVAAISDAGRTACFHEERPAAVQDLLSLADSVDCLTVMGARDPSLASLASDVLQRLAGNSPLKH